MSFKDEREPVIVHYDLELDDAGLDPYQFRAYQRIARRCTGATTGQCFESLESMAEGCKMSRPTLIRAVKVLIERGMIRRLSRQGMTSFYALADKKNWINLADYESQKEQQPGKPESRVTREPGKPESQVTREPGKPESQGVVNQRVRGGKPESQGGGSHIYTKKTHEEYTEEDTVRKPSPPSAQRPRNEFYELFAERYQQAYGCPYQNKKADFVQLAACQKQGGTWLTVEHWLTAIGNYFASPLGTHTLADLSARFGTFFRSTLDRFGKPPSTVSTGLSQKTQGNLAAAQNFLARHGQTLEDAA